MIEIDRYLLLQYLHSHHPWRLATKRSPTAEKHHLSVAVFFPAQKRKGSEEPLSIWIIIYFNDSKKYVFLRNLFQLYKHHRLAPYHAPFFHSRYNKINFQLVALFIRLVPRHNRLMIYNNCNNYLLLLFWHLPNHHQNHSIIHRLILDFHQ